MNYGEIIVIVLSFLSIIISLFAIWLAIVFYRLYTQLSLMVTEMSKGLEVSTIRLERLPKILYNQDLIFPKSAPEDEQNINNNNINRDIKEKKVGSNRQHLDSDTLSSPFGGEAGRGDKGGVKKKGEIMLFDQTAQLLAIIVIVLALCLGLIFYFWSQQLFKKIELMVSKMKQNVDNLEYLSQYIYESAYFNMKERGMVNQNKDSAPSGEIVNNLKKVIEEIQNLRESQIEIKQKLNEKFSSYKSSEQIQNTMPTNPDTILVQSLSPKEEEKYEKIRELIIMYLKDLGSEKGQVTAQDLVYTMPNQYSLADIYRTLEIMKERNQISWLDKRINPQSVLTLP